MLTEKYSRWTWLVKLSVASNQLGWFSTCNLQQIFFTVLYSTAYAIKTSFRSLLPSHSVRTTVDQWVWRNHSLRSDLSNSAAEISLGGFLVLVNLLSLPVTWCTNNLTFNNCTLCPYCIYVFCIYLRTNSDLCHLQHKLIGFYNRDEKCLLRGMNWVFK